MRQFFFLFLLSYFLLSFDDRPPLQAISNQIRTRAPIPVNVQKEKLQEAAKRRALIDSAIANWHEETNKYAEELSERHGKPAQWWLDQFFSNVKEPCTWEKPNLFNAWSWKLAEVHAGTMFSRFALYNCLTFNASEKLRRYGVLLPELQKEHLEEYHNLTEDEKEKLLKEYEEVRSLRSKVKRVTQKSRSQDVRHTCEKIKTQVSSRFRFRYISTPP